MTYKRFTVDLPPDLAEAIAKRVPELGYSSARSYFIGLVLYDLWCRREHKLTLNVMREPSRVRDAAIAQIGEDYLAGKTGRLDASYFERYLQEIVDAAVAKIAGETEVERRENRTAAARRARRENGRPL